VINEVIYIKRKEEEMSTKFISKCYCTTPSRSNQIIIIISNYHIYIEQIR